MCEKFHNDRLRNYRALVLWKSDNNNPKKKHNNNNDGIAWGPVSGSKNREDNDSLWHSELAAHAVPDYESGWYFHDFDILKSLALAIPSAADLAGLVAFWTYYNIVTLTYFTWLLTIWAQHRHVTYRGGGRLKCGSASGKCRNGNIGMKLDPAFSTSAFLTVPIFTFSVIHIHTCIHNGYLEWPNVLTNC